MSDPAMSDGVWLDAPVASSGAVDLTGAGQEMIDILTSAGAALAAGTQARPWGNDEIGQGFDRGYRPAEQQFFAALGALGGHLRTLGEQVTMVVSETQKTDQTSGVRVHNAYREQI